MTVSSTTNRITYAGNGSTTSFATSPVVFFDTSDLVVTAVTDATGATESLVENTDYTVTGGSGSTGTVSTAGGTSPYGAPAAGVTLVILRVVPLTQADDFVNNDINDAEVLEDNLDKLVMIDQQQSEEVGRALKVPSSEGEQTDIVVAGKAGYYLRRNAGGTAFELAVGDANTSTFTQSGTGAVERSVAAKLAERISVTDFGAVGNGTTDDATAVQAADTYAATVGAELYFPPGAYKLGSKVTKDPYTTWIGAPNSQYGVTANDAIGTSGSRIIAGFNGTLVEIDDPGSEVYCGYTGFKGISFFNNPATYAAAKAIVFNDNARQIVMEDFTIKGFEYGLYGSPGEVYLNRGYVVHNKYGGDFFSTAGCLVYEVHLGRGNQTAYVASGIGFTLINANQITVAKCRLQVQRDGPGCQVQSSRGIHFINPIVDQNDTNGIEVIDSTDVDIDAADIFDNGTTSVNAAGVKITAQGYDFTADASTNIITLSSGSATWAASTIVELTTTGTLPAGLATGTQYYVIPVSGSITTFKLATNLANARAGTAIDITDAGTGTHTIHALCGYINITGGRIQDRNLGTAAARQNRCVLFSKSAGGGKIRKISLNGVDVSRMTTRFGAVSSVDTELRIDNCPGWNEMSADNGDAGTTLTIGDDARTQIWNTPLASNRSITLATTGLYEGAEWYVIRTANATGASTLSVGGLKTLAVGEWCVVKVFNGAWVLAQFGAL